MSDGARVEVLADAAEVARRGAALVGLAVQRAAAARGAVAVALSGGEALQGLYGLLGRQDMAARLPWGRVHLYWTDEVCVPTQHSDSNYGRAREAFISRLTIPPENVHRMQGEAEPAAAALAYEHALRMPPLGGATRRHVVVAPRGARRRTSTLPGVHGGARGGEALASVVCPVLDLVVLGLGADGHTAALFPHSAALSERARLCLAVQAPDGTDRLTLTLPVLNGARQVLFVVTGRDKAGIVAEILEGLYLPEALPAQRVDARLGESVWLLDEAAASELSAATLASDRRPG